MVARIAAPSWPRTASSPGTCGRTGPPPTGRSGLLAQLVPPLRRRRGRRAAEADERRARATPAPCACAVHCALVAAGARRGLGTPSSAAAPRAAVRADPGDGDVRRVTRASTWSGCGSSCPATSRSCCCARSRRALPADLDRRRRGDRDRVRAAGRRARPAADPRSAADVLDGARTPLHAVEIMEMRDSIFYAELIFDGGAGSAPGPSDAIALALRVGAPIACAEEVLDEAGIARSRTSRRTRWRSSASSSSRCRPEDFEQPEPGPSGGPGRRRLRAA